MEIHVILILDRDNVDYYLLEFWPLLFKTTQCYKILKKNENWEAMIDGF